MLASLLHFNHSFTTLISLLAPSLPPSFSHQLSFLVGDERHQTAIHRGAVHVAYLLRNHGTRRNLTAVHPLGCLDCRLAGGEGREGGRGGERKGMKGLRGRKYAVLRLITHKPSGAVRCRQLQPTQGSAASHFVLACLPAALPCRLTFSRSLSDRLCSSEREKKGFRDSTSASDR